MALEVEFFDSLEAAQARLRQAMEAADARVKPWQAAVKVGDCFIADGGEEDLLVFGEVLEGYRETHLRHYRFCRCFSVACPEGEVGDVHVSTVLCLVSRAFFEQMRQEGWQMEAGQRPRSACRTIMTSGGRLGAAPHACMRQAMARAGLLRRPCGRLVDGPGAAKGGRSCPRPARMLRASGLPDSGSGPIDVEVSSAA